MEKTHTIQEAVTARFSQVILKPPALGIVQPRPPLTTTVQAIPAASKTAPVAAGAASAAGEDDGDGDDPYASD